MSMSVLIGRDSGRANDLSPTIEIDAHVLRELFRRSGRRLGTLTDEFLSEIRIAHYLDHFGY